MLGPFNQELKTLSRFCEQTFMLIRNEFDNEMYVEVEEIMLQAIMRK